METEREQEEQQSTTTTLNVNNNGEPGSLNHPANRQNDDALNRKLDYKMEQRTFDPPENTTVVYSKRSFTQKLANKKDVKKENKNQKSKQMSNQSEKNFGGRMKTAQKNQNFSSARNSGQGGSGSGHCGGCCAPRRRRSMSTAAAAEADADLQQVMETEDTAEHNQDLVVAEEESVEASNFTDLLSTTAAVREVTAASAAAAATAAAASSTDRLMTEDQGKVMRKCQSSVDKYVQELRVACLASNLLQETRRNMAQYAAKDQYTLDYRSWSINYKEKACKDRRCKDLEDGQLELYFDDSRMDVDFLAEMMEPQRLKLADALKYDINAPVNVTPHRLPRGMRDVKRNPHREHVVEDMAYVVSRGEQMSTGQHDSPSPPSLRALHVIDHYTEIPD